MIPHQTTDYDDNAHDKATLVVQRAKAAARSTWISVAVNLLLTIAQIAARLELPLWHIGEIVAGQAGEVTVYDPDFNPVNFERKGYDHFAA